MLLIGIWRLLRLRLALVAGLVSRPLLLLMMMRRRQRRVRSLSWPHLLLLLRRIAPSYH